MKKKLIILTAMVSSTFAFSQMGINTATPNAALDIVSKGNTNATKALKINDNTNKELVSVSDNGSVRLENYKNINLLGTDANGNLMSAQTLNIPSLSAIGSAVVQSTFNTANFWYTVPFTANKIDPSCLTYDAANKRFIVQKAGYYAITTYIKLKLDGTTGTGGSSGFNIGKVATNGTTKSIISYSNGAYGDGTQGVGGHLGTTTYFNAGEAIYIEAIYTLKFYIEQGSINIIYYGA
ncbi:hypothetical protein [Chryseobacterium sp. IT-36CA2]|uniref:hypothetical protein n=1 Tax=Chryseobacterium sp. IT-36CA2 TaxID=3026460 RepID=UPI0039DFF285